jgi:hypothetical protein
VHVVIPSGVIGFEIGRSGSGDSGTETDWGVLAVDSFGGVEFLDVGFGRFWRSMVDRLDGRV